MGAPAVTWFCRNGHIVLDIPHGYIAEFPTECPHCDSKEFRFETEWSDPEYTKPIVPVKPIRYEHKIIEVDVPVYNVNKLFKRRSK